ncbi:hypothetical protein D5086_021463 [Populus alba]|uniref:Uncharacterized protein n=2 Tax=Populus alba TaxID=43335 RepID=A0ACC4BCE5_POPAL|nr:hypothetical protein D5086_0000081800 [Populus alba]
MALIPENKLIFAVLLLLGLWTSHVWSPSLYEASMMERHETWMALYGRVYNDHVEKERRLNIFKNNVELIESFNKVGKKPYKLSVNEFADLTNEEFRASRNGYKILHFRYENASAVPSTMDWRKKGAVTPIKDQGQCEQELVDCDTSGEDQGCNGGLMDDAFDFIIQNKGLTTEANYPYQGADGACNSGKAAAKITGYAEVPANSEAALLKAVANQPVSVAIDAGGSAFQF